MPSSSPEEARTDSDYTQIDGIGRKEPCPYSRVMSPSLQVSDLYNWKTPSPPFSEEPQALIRLLGDIFYAHQPTWDDCQKL